MKRPKSIWGIDFSEKPKPLVGFGNWITQMIFSHNSNQLLQKMRINPVEYSKYLEEQFSDKAKFFELMCRDFHKKNPNHENHYNSYLLDFFKQYNIVSDNDWLRNCLQEWATNLERYWDEGVLSLFQHRNHDWGTPEVIITKADVEKSDVNSLNPCQTIYRGMCKEEHISGNYRQSWTLKKSVALRFAKQTYEAQPNGIVVKTKIKRNHILYYDKSTHKIDGEDEVIIQHGYPSKSDVIICD